MKPIVSIRTALEDPNLLGVELSGDSWLAMRTLAIAAFGEPLTDEERTIFTKLTGGREHESLKRVKRFICVAGRRAGKSQIAAALCVYLGLLCDHSDNLSIGEKGVVLCISQNVAQSAIVFNYCVGLLKAQPILWKEVVSVTREAIVFKNGIEIQIRPSSFRGLRGLTCVGVIADEACFWFTEEANSQNSNSEIIAAITPTLITTKGMLIIISSPYARRGVVWKFYSKHYGPNGDPLTLVAQGASRDFNSEIDQSEIDEALEEDYAVACAEWLGQFRDDLEGFLSMEAIRACVAPGVYELPPQIGMTYSAFVDAATGAGQDDFAMAIGHLEGDMLIVDAIRTATPPFSPESVVSDFSQLALSYGIGTVWGDNFASGFVRELFNKNGLAYEPSKLTTSELYLNFLGTINAKKCQLLDHQKSQSQLANLERRTGFAGKDRVSHPVGMHDDASCVIAGLSAIVRDELGNLDMIFRMWGLKPTIYEEQARARAMLESRKQEAAAREAASTSSQDSQSSSIDESTPTPAEQERLARETKQRAELLRHQPSGDLRLLQF